MAQVTIHRALSMKKTLPSRIIAAKRATTFAIANRNTNAKINGISVEDTGKNILSAKQAVWDLFTEYQKIVTAIALSNSTTKVTIGGIEYTVTEAIQLKKLFEVKRSILELMRSDFRVATGKVNTENETLEVRAAEFATKGSSGDKSGAGIKPDALKELQDMYRKANEYALIDPLGLEGLISKFEAEIVAFESEVDAVLSESNAVTLVEIG